jgi:hypothetical protein
MDRLLRQRRKLKEEWQNKYERACRATAAAKKVLEDLERIRDLQPVSQEYLDEIAKYQRLVGAFVPARDSRREKFHRLSRENDALESQIGLSVESLFVYGENLRNEEPLQILANNETFWMFFEARQMASAAAETVKTQLRAVAEEQLAIRNRLESRSKHALAGRLSLAELKRSGVYPAAKLAEISDEDRNELDLERLSDLELQRDRLTYDESFRDPSDGIYRSRQLLKLAERAITDAGLLKTDDDGGHDQEEQYATAHAVLGSGDGNGFMASSHLAASRMEMSEAGESGEAQPNGSANMPDPATQPTLEETITSRLATAATMTAMDIKGHFERVRDDFRARRQDVEAGPHRRLTEEELAKLPQPLSGDDEGAALFRKLVSYTSAYRLAEKEFHAWREAGWKYSIEPDLRKELADFLRSQEGTLEQEGPGIQR